MQTWTVSRAEHGESLLDFLSERLRLSRRRAKTLLDARAVFVNHRRIWMARHVLRAGDVVEVASKTSPPPLRSTGRIPILYEDADFIVVDKPAGQPVDGPRGVEEECRNRFRSRQIALVHRLDKDTSGCLMLAKHPAARDWMVSMFEQRRVLKVYHVIVLGEFPARAKTITKELDGLMAVTHVMRISANDRASHLRVRIETGRTHQIRKHMAALRHPVLGDRTYATGPLEDPLLRNVSRQMLHAELLAFPHRQTGELIRVKSALPADFVQQLGNLRLR
jgi:RluA family pseudouridine synthase